MFQNYRTFIAVCCLFLIPLAVPANSDESILLFSISHKSKARVGIVNSGKKALKLEIVNNNKTLYFDKSVLGNQNFFQVLDLSSMANGEYSVRLLSGLDELEQKKFIVTDGRAVIVKKQKEVAPLFKMADQKSLIISYLNANSNSVSVFFEMNDEVVFEERDINEMPMSKRYSLSNLPKGYYTVKLYSGGTVYTYNISL